MPFFIQHGLASRTSLIGCENILKIPPSIKSNARIVVFAVSAKSSPRQSNERRANVDLTKWGALVLGRAPALNYYTTWIYKGDRQQQAQQAAAAACVLVIVYRTWYYADYGVRAIVRPRVCWVFGRASFETNKQEVCVRARVCVCLWASVCSERRRTSWGRAHANVPMCVQLRCARRPPTSARTCDTLEIARQAGPAFLFSQVNNIQMKFRKFICWAAALWFDVDLCRKPGCCTCATCAHTRANANTHARGCDTTRAREHARIVN